MQMICKWAGTMKRRGAFPDTPSFQMKSLPGLPSEAPLISKEKNLVSEGDFRKYLADAALRGGAFRRGCGAAIELECPGETLLEPPAALWREAGA